jgi:uncharacterized phage protein (TIGR02218 family)
VDKGVAKLTAYDDSDRSPRSGKPAELFQFTGGVYANYTTAQDRVSYGGLDYLPDYIIHGEIEQTEELNKQTLEITMKGSSEVARLYIAEIPPRSVNVRVYRFIVGIGEYRLIWAGRVVKPVFSSDSDECVLQCEPIFTLLKRPGLRRNYQLLCPYVLFDDRCKMEMASFMIEDVVADKAANWLAGPGIASKAAGWFTGGILRRGTVYRLIVDNSGGRIYLGGGVAKIAVGDKIQVVAGCAKSLAACEGKFGNSINFGGFPYMPDKNPFSGDSLYS